MASKTHCDLCDETPATNLDEKRVPHHLRPRPAGRPHPKLIIKVAVYDEDCDDGGVGLSTAGNLKDICDDCRRKLVAEAYGLLPREDYHSLQDELNEVIRVCREELAQARAAAGQPEEPQQVPNHDDIPF